MASSLGPLPQALSEAEFAAIVGRDKAYQSETVHVSYHVPDDDRHDLLQHISTLQTQLHYYKSQSSMWGERSRVWFAELEHTKSQLEQVQREVTYERERNLNNTLSWENQCDDLKRELTASREQVKALEDALRKITKIRLSWNASNAMRTIAQQALQVGGGYIRREGTK